MTTIRNSLTMSQNIKLCNLINKEYKTLRLSDSAFAKFATEKLKFSVNWSQVYGRRHSLGIERQSKAKKVPVKLTLSLEKRVESLEKDLLYLYKKLNVV